MRWPTTRTSPVVDERLARQDADDRARRRRVVGGAAAAARADRRRRRRRPRPLGRAGQQRAGRRHDRPGAAPRGRPGAGARRLVRGVDRLGRSCRGSRSLPTATPSRPTTAPTSAGTSSPDASPRRGAATGSARSSRRPDRSTSGPRPRVLTDDHDAAGGPLLALLLGLPDLPEPSRAVVERLRGWDRSMAEDSVGAGTFGAVRDAVVAAIVAHPLLDPARTAAPPVHGEVLAPWWHLPSRVARVLPDLVVDPPAGLDLRRHRQGRPGRGRGRPAPEPGATGTASHRSTPSPTSGSTRRPTSPPSPGSRSAATPSAWPRPPGSRGRRWS